jgi:hypothetical protein
MALRVARGLFRLWIVGTALFVIAVSCISYSSIRAEFDGALRPNKVFKFTGPDGSVFEVRAPDKNSAVAAVDFRNPPPPESVIDLPTLNPWARVARVAGIAFGIPLAVLILGASLVWAFSGFSAKRP